MEGDSIDAPENNRGVVLPDTDHHSKTLQEIQSMHLKTIEESFSPIPITTAKLFDRELIGMEMLQLLAEEEMLQLLAEELYQDDPTEIFYDRIPITIAREEGADVMSIHLPFISSSSRRRTDHNRWKQKTNHITADQSCRKGAKGSEIC